MLKSDDALKLCLVSDVEPVRAAVRASCLPPHEVVIFGLEGFLNPNNTLSTYGESVVQKTKDADAVLVGWSLAHAPLINTVCHAVRSRKAFIPVIALCSGGQEEMIAALAAGVDDVTGFPLYLPLLQARVVAYRRVVKGVRRATAKHFKKKLIAQPHLGKALVEQKAGVLVKEMIEELEQQMEGLEGAPFLSDQQHRAVIQQTTQALEEEAALFVEALVEGVAGALVQEVETELVLTHQDHHIQAIGALRLDRTAYRVYLADDEVELTPKEFELLSFLMGNVGTLCSRDRILNEVWGIDFDTGTNMVDVYMHFLRKKLSAHGLGGMLQTVRGRGYRLMAPDTPEGKT